MSLVRVVKGLECCCKWLGCGDCEDCPYYLSIRCNVKLMQDALAVVDELQAHNENLKKENKYLRERLAEEMKHAEDVLNKSQ